MGREPQAIQPEKIFSQQLSYARITPQKYLLWQLEAIFTSIFERTRPDSCRQKTQSTKAAGRGRGPFVRGFLSMRKYEKGTRATTRERQSSFFDPGRSLICSNRIE